MLLILIACFISDAEVDRALDPDGDGFGPEEDCAPMDPVVYPGAEEVCGDGVVNDCGMPEEEARAFCRLYGLRYLSHADLKFFGQEEGDSMGESVSGAGDVDGDGRADLLLGAHSHSYGGAAYLLLSSTALSGDTGQPDLGAADVKLVGESPGDSVGAAVSRAGDVDGDGRADLLVGAFNHADGDGAAYLLLSSGVMSLERLSLSGVALNLSDADLKIAGEDVGDAAGRRLSAAGWIDDDDRGDLIVGAPYQSGGGDKAGAAYLLLSSGALNKTGLTLNLADADLKLLGEAPGDKAGEAVSGGRDSVEDGEALLLVGAPSNDSSSANAGAAYLVRAPASLAGPGAILDLGDADLKLIGEQEGDIAGYAAAIVGDVEGDGRVDLLVGAPWHGSGGTTAGAAYLLLSSGALHNPPPTLSLSAADLKLIGEESGDSAGFAVAGDMDGDQLADVVVGAYLQDRGGANAGGGYLLLSSGTLATGAASVGLADSDLTLVGMAAGDQTGTSVSSAGDVNGDGLDDLLIGAHAADHDGVHATGAAYLLFGHSF